MQFLTFAPNTTSTGSSGHRVELRMDLVYWNLMDEHNSHICGFKFFHLTWDAT